MHAFTHITAQPSSTESTFVKNTSVFPSDNHILFDFLINFCCQFKMT